MDQKTLSQVVAQVHRRYPEFDDCKPRVRRQPVIEGSSAADATYLLTFQKSGQVKSASGTATLTRILRVVVNAQGKIIKVSTSR